MTDKDFADAYNNADTLKGLAASMGASPRTIRSRADRLGLPRKPRRDAEYIPTPAEIEAACAAYRSSWSDEEREIRSLPYCGKVPDYVQ